MSKKNSAPKFTGPQTPEWWAARIRTHWDGKSQKARDILCLEIATQCQLAARKDKIVITYYGDREPRVQAHRQDHKRIVLIDGEEEAATFMEHQGVRIYTTDWNGCVADNWFATERGLDKDQDSESMFDVRDLDTPPAAACARLAKQYPQDARKVKIAYAIEQGKICLDALV